VAPRVGLLFPGEMGAQVGAAARADVRWASDGRSPATARRAADAGLRDARTLAELVAGSDIVLSICPPAIAEEVAGRVAETGFQGLYVEANAVAPARAERIAAALAARGARIVDGSIIASRGLHLYLSGPRADVDEVAALFTDSPVTTIPLEGAIGVASGLKMAFGGWNKIGAALTAQAFAIARAYGVEAELEREGVEPARVVGAGPKAWRWAPEMTEVADTCAHLGLPDGIGRGAADLYERWSAHRDRPAELERLLDDLYR
jgi:3-hydroxyisobutyrate dehydrogenase-like beta-hydroxyacid dehydrogenase